MNKRDFLASVAIGGMLPAMAMPARAATDIGQVVLTVIGADGHGNRGPIDVVRDQMMAKKELRFERAQVFDSPSLQALPAVIIKPTLEYDGRVHALSGPLLSSVIEFAGGPLDEQRKVSLHAIDGYVVTISLADARANGTIIATHIDGERLAIGGLGPQWAVHDADRLEAFRDKPLNERFALCPWGLYLIEILPA